MKTSEQHTGTDLVTLFILRPVSSDQTDFISDSNKMHKGN